MIGIMDDKKKLDAFYQVARDITRYIHFGGYDVIDDLVDTSYMTIDKIKKFFIDNPQLLPDDPLEPHIAENKDLYRTNKLNNLTYDIEYDFVKGNNTAYMTLFLQFVYDEDEPYITVEIQDIRKK